MASVRKTNESVKSEMIRVRVTPEEHERFFQIAASRGFASISDLIRSLLNEQSEVKQETQN